MIIIKVIGGLGNQMFQFAFLRYLENKFPKYKYKIDISSFNSYNKHSGFELGNTFSLNKFEIAHREEICAYKRDEHLFIGKFLNKMCGRKKTHIIESQFQKKVFTDGKYLDGYWQNKNIVNAIEPLIRSEFEFAFSAEYLGEKNNLIISQIKVNNSASIHIRRGDYLIGRNNDVFGGICTLEYYNNAIKKLSTMTSDIYYFIFSDDIEWAKLNLSLNKERAIFVDWNKGSRSHIDMMLMSLCKNNIIANSSFSWWAAWLNTNENKIVISPSKWVNNNNISVLDLLPSSWIKIKY